MGAWLLQLVLVGAVQIIAKEGQPLSLRSLVNIASMVNEPETIGNPEAQDRTYARLMGKFIEGAQQWQREHASPGSILEGITTEADNLLKQIETSPLMKPFKPWQVMSADDANRIGGRATSVASLLETGAEATGKAKVGWPDQILPDLSNAASQLRGEYQKIMQAGRSSDMKGVREFSKVERDLQKEIEVIKRDMEDNKGRVDTAGALLTVMQETKNKIESTISKDKNTIGGIIQMIEKSYYDNNCIIKTGLLFQGEECPKEYPGAQVFAAHKLVEYSEELQDELLDDFDDEKKKVEEKKGAMQKDCGKGVEMIQKFSDTQKEAVEDSLETRKVASDTKTEEGKAFLNNAEIKTKEAFNDIKKMTPFLEKMESAHAKDVTRTETDIERTKERTINAIMKMAEAGFKGLDVSSMGMLSALVKNYAAGDKALADGGATLEDAIADKYSEMVEQINKQTEALGDGPANLAKELEKLQSGSMVKGFGEATSIGQQIGKTEQNNEAQFTKSGNLVDAAMQGQLGSGSVSKATEDGEAAQLAGATNEATSDLAAKAEAALANADTFAQLTAEDQQKVLEYLLANGHTLEELEARFGKDAGEKLGASDILLATKRYTDLFDENAKNSRESMQKGYETDFPDALASAEGEAENDAEEVKHQITALEDRDLGRMKQEITKSKGSFDTQAREGISALQDSAAQIVKDVNDMTAATRTTQTEANKADAAIQNFEQNDLVPWKQSALMAAQGLGREASEATSRLRSEINRKLQTAKGETTLAAANLAKDTEQFLAAKKSIIQEDDQKTRTQFAQLKMQFEEDAKAAVESALAAAEVKIKHAQAMVPDHDRRYKDAQNKIKAIVDKLATIHPVDVESLVQASKDQFHELLQKTLSQALEELESGEDGYTATSGKAENAAMDEVNTAATSTEDAAEKLQSALVSQFKHLLTSQNGLLDRVKALQKEGTDHEEETLSLLAALSQTSGEASGETKISLADFNDKMKQEASSANGEIIPALDAVLSNANPVFEQFMTGVMSKLDANTQRAAGKMAQLAQDVTDKEKQLKESHDAAMTLMKTSGTHLEQFLTHAAGYSEEMRAKLGGLLGVDLAAGSEAADQQRRQAGQATGAAFGMLGGIEKMWDGAAKNDIEAKMKASGNLVAGEFQAASAAEKEAEAETEADRERKKAALAEAADAFSSHVDEANAKWLEISRSWAGLSQENQRKAQSLTSQGRSLVPNFVEESARLKVRRNDMIKEVVGLLAGLFQLTFNGAQKMMDTSKSHSEASMGYVNKLANVEGNEAIQILDKLRDAHVMAQNGDTEIVSMLDDAKEYAKLDTAWRHEVVKAFVKLNERDGEDQANILKKIQALNATIIHDVFSEQHEDEAEIAQEEDQLRKEAAAEGERTKEELEYIAGQERERNEATDQRIKEGQDAANGALDGAGADLDSLESDLSSLSKNAAGVDDVLDTIKMNEKAKQDEVQRRVQQERAAVQQKMAAVASGGSISDASSDASTDAGDSDAGSDAGADDASDADIFADDSADSSDSASSDSTSDDSSSASSSESDAPADSSDGATSFLQAAQRKHQLRRTGLDGNKVMAMIENGVPEEEVAKLLMERHRALVAKYAGAKLDKLEQYRNKHPQ